MVDEVDSAMPMVDEVYNATHGRRGRQAGPVDEVADRAIPMVDEVYSATLMVDEADSAIPMVDEVDSVIPMVDEVRCYPQRNSWATNPCCKSRTRRRGPTHDLRRLAGRLTDTFW